VKQKKEWLVTLDNRIRYTRAMLDGKKADVDQPFKVNGYEIIFPGDKTAHGSLVYIYRWTRIASVDRVDTSNTKGEPGTVCYRT
jgi:hypothetical protein